MKRQFKNKRGMIAFEYVIIFALVAIGSIAVAYTSKADIIQIQNTTQVELSDDDAYLDTNHGSVAQLVEEILVNPGNITMPIGETRRLVASVRPATLWNAKLRWTDVTNNGLIDIDVDTGTMSAVITGLGVGNGQIVVSTTDGSSANKIITYYVYQPAAYRFTPNGATINSNQAVTYSLQSSPVTNEWRNKEVKIEVLAGNSFADFTINNDLKQIVVKPKALGNIKIQATITDTVDSSLNQTVTLDLRINPVYSDWDVGQTNDPNERSRKEYTMTANTGWTDWTTEDLEYPSRRWRTEYSKKDATWSALSINQPNAPEADISTGYMYRYRDVTSWDNTLHTDRGNNDFYLMLDGYQRYQAAAWSDWSETKPNHNYYKTSTQSKDVAQAEWFGNKFYATAGRVELITFPFSRAVTLTRIRANVDIMNNNWDGSTYIKAPLLVECLNANDGVIATLLNTSSGPVTAEDYWSGTAVCNKVRFISKGDTGNTRNYTNAISIDVDYNIPTNYTAYSTVTSWSHRDYSLTCGSGDNTGGYKCENRTLYKFPLTWSTWTTYSETLVNGSSTRQVERATGYKYKIWGEWTAWGTTEYVPGDMRQIKTRITYSYPTYSSATNWQPCPANNCPTSTTGAVYGYRTTYSRPLYATIN